MERRLLPADAVICVALAGPALAIVALTSGLGGLPVALAVFLALAAVVATWLLVRRPLHDLREGLGYVRRLAVRTEPAIPTMRTAAGREFVAVIVRIHDALTVESRGHAALAASQEATLDSLPDPLLLVDAVGRVVGANIAARGLLDRDPLGADLAAILRVPSVLDAVDRVLAGTLLEDAEFILPGLTDRFFMARVKGLSGSGSDGARLVLSLHEISAMRRSERMRAEFVANASHELRTPLASLQGFIETLAGPARDDAAAREYFLPIMLQTATRMARLIDDLLSLSRIEFDEHTQPKEPADLAQVTRSVADGLVPQAVARDMSLEVHVPADLPRVRGQADQLAQVVQNLIENAVKYGHAGTRVEISLAAEDGFLALSVRDHGQGIPRQYLPRLTERFFRCDAARSREMGGTGLGLAIVKHIVNRHRGTLAIDSTVGQGSVFTVRVPVFTG